MSTRTALIKLSVLLNRRHGVTDYQQRVELNAAIIAVCTEYAVEFINDSNYPTIGATS